MRGVAIGYGVLLACAPPAMATILLDHPLTEQTLSAPDPGGDPGRALKIHCATYPTFMVRDVQVGDDIGTASVSVTPITPSSPARCSATQSSQAKELPAFGSMAVDGAVGRFLLLIWPDGANGATSFSIFDTVAVRKLYTDTVKLDGFTRFATGPGGDTLELGFVRVLNVPCSLLSGGGACWNRYVREAKLPAEIARREPPVQACASAYARATGPVRVEASDPSVVAYPVAMTLSVAGITTVLSRGELSCWPSE
jgi:hypothetical protein